MSDQHLLDASLSSDFGKLIRRQFLLLTQRLIFVHDYLSDANQGKKL